MSTRPKKSLGQHFLSDRNILASVAAAADVGSSDTVIEIGPGRGALTQVLANGSYRVVAVEIDGTLATELRTHAMANVEVVEADARVTSAQDLLGGCRPYKMVGNLPYYAALPILRSFLESSCRPTKIAILVQLEVASQLCAVPGSMSMASLGVQLFGTPRIFRRVPPGAFTPRPKVMSAVVGIDVFPEPAAGVVDIAGFFAVARAGFSSPRKQLHKSLANGLGVPASVLEALLNAAGIDPTRRAQSLSVVEWANLADRVLTGYRNSTLGSMTP